MISVERLRELFELREDGTLVRKVSRGGKRVFRKSFATVREAAEAYVLESLEHHGEFSPFWSRTA